MDFVVLSLFALLAFISRVVNLLEVPIFTDEAIYIRWAQIGLNDPAHRFISLTDGKQPLFTWLMYPFLSIFTDPLFAGRFVSVLSSMLAVSGIYFLAKELFNRKTAVFACILYLISPFALLYDRLALMDSLLSALLVWCLYFTVMLTRYSRLYFSFMLGITAGFGLLTKSSAAFGLYLLPFSLLLFNFSEKNNLNKLLKWAVFSFLSIIIAQIIYNLLRLSPYFYIIEQKNYSFIMTFDEFIKSPLRIFLPNLNGLTGWLFSYLTIPVAVITIINLIISIIKVKRIIFLLFLWFIIPFLALAFLGKVIFPRFILFMTMPLLIIAADCLSRFYSFARIRMKYAYIVILLILAQSFYISLVLIVKPVNADIPLNDRNQFFDDWPSGFGVRQVVDYIENESRKGKVVLGTEGTFGLNPAAYEIYLKSNDNIIIKGYWPVKSVPAELKNYARLYPTYLVFKDTQEFPGNWPLKLVARYRRGLKNTYLYFYQVIPED